jgi:Zn-dependent protease with chaperone function
LRADTEGAKAVSPEALISVFQSFQARFKKDEGSDTHPSLQERIDRLMPLLEEDNQEQST